jgi:dihydroxyacid dehydratase/phosphogluconate dehydratase
VLWHSRHGGRLGIALPLSRFDELARSTPTIANIKSSGKHLMEDFYYAGGVPALMNQMLPFLHGNEMTVSGKTIAENVKNAKCYNADVIRSLEQPLYPDGSLAVLHGNLCPDSAVIKTSAASPNLLQHTGRAVGFERYEEMLQRNDDPALDVQKLRARTEKRRPRGGPGMPEWGQIPIPSKLLKRGISDMVRISDSRMSGTSYGAVVLHISPESATGRPLAAVRNGDSVRLDVKNRRLDLLVSEAELCSRMEAWCPAPKRYRRGYYTMFLDHILQADKGCDFDFLVGQKDEVPYEPVVGRS